MAQKEINFLGWKIATFALIFLVIGIGFYAGGYFISDAQKEPLPFFKKLFTDGGLAVITGCVVAMIFKKYFDNDSHDQIASSIKNEFFNFDTIEKIREEYGILKMEKDIRSICSAVNTSVSKSVINIYENRSEIDFNKLILNSKKHIDILTTNLHSLKNNDSALIKSVEENKDLIIRVVSILPNHPFVKRRIVFDKTKRSSKDFFEEIKVGLNIILELKEKISKVDKERLFIKTHECDPKMMIYRFDDILIIGFIFKQGSSRMFTHLKLNATDKNVNCFLTHFNKVYEDSKEISTEELDKLEYASTSN